MSAPRPATAFELASERHWNGLEQYVPWLALLLLLATVCPPGRARATPSSSTGTLRPEGAQEA